jgi:outer membrane protein assembly factor BamD
MPFQLMRRLLAPACAGVLLAGCLFRSSHTTMSLTPEDQYRAAMHLFRTGEYAHAQEGFQRLQFDLPNRDTLLPRARFYNAESYAGMNEYITAAREFRRVADDFPSDQLAPVALLRVGDQYSRLWRRPELDPSNGETALAAYQELIGRYPDTQAARTAQLRVLELHEMYARKDFENGMFYYKRGGFDSAILYFRSLIAQYPDASVVGDAYVKLVESYTRIGYREEKEETCAHLRQYFGGRADVRHVCGNGSPGR